MPQEGAPKQNTTEISEETKESASSADTETLAEIKESASGGDFDHTRDLFETLPDGELKTDAATAIATALIISGNERGAQAYLQEIPDEWDRLAALSDVVHDTLRTKKAEGRELLQELLSTISDEIDQDKAREVLLHADEDPSADQIIENEAEEAAKAGNFEQAIDRAGAIQDDRSRSQVLSQVSWEILKHFYKIKDENDRKSCFDMACYALDQIPDPKDKAAAAMNILIQGKKSGEAEEASPLVSELFESIEMQKEYSALAGMTPEKAQEGGTDKVASSKLWKEFNETGK